jgi:hypothetical protein
MQYGMSSQFNEETVGSIGRLALYNANPMDAAAFFLFLFRKWLGVRYDQSLCIKAGVLLLSSHA